MHFGALLVVVAAWLQWLHFVETTMAAHSLFDLLEFGHTREVQNVSSLRKRIEAMEYIKSTYMNW